MCRLTRGVKIHTKRECEKGTAAPFSNFRVIKMRDDVAINKTKYLLHLERSIGFPHRQTLNWTMQPYLSTTSCGRRIGVLPGVLPPEIKNLFLSFLMHSTSLGH